MRARNTKCEYSTASTRRRDDITGGARILPARDANGGPAGTDRAAPHGPQAVLTSSSETERRRAGAASRGPAYASAWRESRATDPLTPRHALRHLTTLRARRLRGAWLTKSTVGETRSSAPTSIKRRRRITRTRLGAMAETRVIRAKGFESLPVWQGEVVYGDLAHRDISRAACVAELSGARVVVRAHLFVDHWVFGGTSRRRRLPNRFGLVRINGSLTGAAGASRVQVIFRRRLLS